MKRTGVVPWPEEAVRRYVAAGYWRGKPLGDQVWSWAERYGERVAVVDGECRLTYRDLAERVDLLALNLLASGLRDGDNILVQLPNRWEFLALFLACQRIGVAPVLSLLAHREHELGHLADLADVRAVVVPDRWQDFDHQDLAAKLAVRGDRPRTVIVLGDEVHSGHLDLAGMLSPDDPAAVTRRPWAATATRRQPDPAAATRPQADPAATRQQPDPAATRRAALDAIRPDSREVALFLLSGGTTGTPKVIARTHDDYEYNVRRSAEVCGFDEDVVYLVTLPMAHNFPLGSPGVLGTLMNGGRVVMIGSPRPQVAFAAVQTERVTHSPLVPAIGQRWADAARAGSWDLSSLRTVQIGGSVLPDGLVVRLRETLGCHVQQVYGMAEGLLNYTRADDPDDVVACTQGRPICPDDELLIVDEDGSPVPPGSPGELLTRGPYTPRGYFRAAEHNAVAYTPDGWYRTGDVVRVHPSGNLVVETRVKDLVNRGGEKVSGPEVETLALALPQVRQAAVVPTPDPALGERVCLCVVPHAGESLTLAQVQQSFEARGVARYKTPERLEVFDEFPLTPIGKVDKKALRRLLA